MNKTLILRLLSFLLVLGLLFETFTLKTEAKDVKTTEYKIYVVLATSNLRAEPSKQGRWVATVPHNEYVILLDATDTDFRHVKYNGLEGYIYSGCIKKLEGKQLQDAMQSLDISSTAADIATAALSKATLKIPESVQEYRDGRRGITLSTRFTMMQAEADESLTEAAEEEAAADADADTQEKEVSSEEKEDKTKAPLENKDDKLEAADASDAKDAGEKLADSADASDTKDAGEKLADSADASDAKDAGEKLADTTDAEEDVSENKVSLADVISATNVGASFVGGRKKEGESETKTYEQAQIRANAVMRSLPSTDSSKIMTITRDSYVTVLDDGENGYLHITYEGQEGYVIAKAAVKDGKRTQDSGILNTIVAEEKSNSTSPILATRHRSLNSSTAAIMNYIQQEQDVTVENEELAAASEPVAASMLSNSDIDYQIRTRANMRMTPNRSGDWVTTVPTGANVDVLGETANGYTLVQYNGIKGYVLESVVVDSVDFTAASSDQTVLFTLTGYCTCAKCCGSFSPEITGGEAHTATGTTPTEGRTIAVDPKVIPYGSVVHIDGLGDYIAEDCGGAVKGNHIDVFFNNHEDALKFGRQKRYVSVN